MRDIMAQSRAPPSKLGGARDWRHESVVQNQLTHRASSVGSGTRTVVQYHDDSESRGWPRWWRLVVIGVSTLVLCSCRSMDAPVPDAAAAAPAAHGQAGGVSPLMAQTHAPPY